METIKKLKLKQPNNSVCNTVDQALKIAKKIKYPMVVRPSYVLGGRAMEIVHDESQMKNYVSKAVDLFGEKHHVVLENHVIGFFED